MSFSSALFSILGLFSVVLTFSQVGILRKETKEKGLTLSENDLQILIQVITAFALSQLVSVVGLSIHSIKRVTSFLFRKLFYGSSKKRWVITNKPLDLIEEVPDSVLISSNPMEWRQGISVVSGKQISCNNYKLYYCNDISDFEAATRLNALVNLGAVYIREPEVNIFNEITGVPLSKYESINEIMNSKVVYYYKSHCDFEMSEFEKSLFNFVSVSMGFAANVGVRYGSYTATIVSISSIGFFIGVLLALFDALGLSANLVWITFKSIFYHLLKIYDVNSENIIYKSLLNTFAPCYLFSNCYAMRDLHCFKLIKGCSLLVKQRPAIGIDVIHFNNSNSGNRGVIPNYTNELRIPIIQPTRGDSKVLHCFSKEKTFAFLNNPNTVVINDTITCILGHEGTIKNQAMLDFICSFLDSHCFKNQIKKIPKENLNVMMLSIFDVVWPIFKIESSIVVNNIFNFNFKRDFNVNIGNKDWKRLLVRVRDVLRKYKICLKGVDNVFVNPIVAHNNYRDDRDLFLNLLNVGQKGNLEIEEKEKGKEVIEIKLLEVVCSGNSKNDSVECSHKPLDNLANYHKLKIKEIALDHSAIINIKNTVNSNWERIKELDDSELKVRSKNFRNPSAIDFERYEIRRQESSVTARSKIFESLSSSIMIKKSLLKALCSFDPDSISTEYKEMFGVPEQEDKKSAVEFINSVLKGSSEGDDCLKSKNQKYEIIDVGGYQRDSLEASLLLRSKFFNEKLYSFINAKSLKRGKRPYLSILPALSLSEGGKHIKSYGSCNNLIKKFFKVIKNKKTRTKKGVKSNNARNKKLNSYKVLSKSNKIEVLNDFRLNFIKNDKIVDQSPPIRRETESSRSEWIGIIKRAEESGKANNLINNVKGVFNYFESGKRKDSLLVRFTLGELEPPSEMFKFDLPELDSSEKAIISDFVSKMPIHKKGQKSCKHFLNDIKYLDKLGSLKASELRINSLEELERLKIEADEDLKLFISRLTKGVRED